MGTRPGHRPDAPTRLHAQTANSGGIRKILIALAPNAFEHALSRWAESLLGGPPPPSALEAFALDGKTARGSFDGLEKAVHLLALVAHESGLTLAQTAVPKGGQDKTNEHKTALRWLEGLVLEGRLITGDAIFCQRDLSAGHRRPGPLPLVRQREPTDAPDRYSGRLRRPREGAFSP